MSATLFDSYQITDSAVVKINRSGHIADIQKDVFGSKVILFDMVLGSFKRWITIGLLIFFGFAVAIAAIGYLPVLKRHSETSLWLLFGVTFLALVVHTLWRIIAPLRQWRMLQQELQKEEVASAEGELHFGEKGFYIAMDGKKQVVRYGNVTALKPGIRYRIYYLPGSQVLLAAEATEPVTRASVAEGLTALLAEANGFSLDALPNNRQGRLASHQYSRLYRHVFWKAVGLLVVAGVAFYWVFQLGGGDFSIPALVLDAILVGFFFYFIYSLSRTVRDLLQKEVLVVEGIGKKKMVVTDDDDGEQRTYYYVIGDQQFVVSKKGYEALLEGERYRAYYTPASNVLVNVEALI
jgi:hypothetical protein